MTDTDTAPRWAEIAGTLEPWLVHAPLDAVARRQVAALFAELGFVVVRGALDPALVDELEADLTRAHRTLMRGELDRRHAAPELEPPNQTVVDGLPFLNYVVYASQASEVADRAIRASAVAEVCPTLLAGESFLYDYDRHGVMYLDARGASAYKGLVWHPDFESTPDLPIWPAVAFTVHIDGTSPENGFLRILPGSHRVAPDPRPAGYRKVPGEVAVYCERGDLLFHHSHLWHAAGRPSDEAAVRRHLRGKWCSGPPVPAGAWDGSFDNSATRASGR